jgi:hypothetical protein
VPPPPIPVDRELVPPAAPAAPGGFTPITEAVADGLPHVIALVPDLRLVLAVPTGLANAWREADPAAVVSSSDGELAPPPPHAGDGETGALGRPPACLVALRGREVLGVVPLVAGVLRRLPDAGAPGRGVTLEVVVLGWDLRAGSLCGPGDVGTRLALAWRPVGAGAAAFAPPATNPHVAARLEAAFRLESDTGGAQP